MARHRSHYATRGKPFSLQNAIYHIFASGRSQRTPGVKDALIAELNKIFRSGSKPRMFSILLCEVLAASIEAQSSLREADSNEACFPSDRHWEDAVASYRRPRVQAWLLWWPERMEMSYRLGFTVAGMDHPSVRSLMRRS